MKNFSPLPLGFRALGRRELAGFARGEQTMDKEALGVASGISFEHVTLCWVLALIER